MRLALACKQAEVFTVLGMQPVISVLDEAGNFQKISRLIFPMSITCKISY
jgi:hypothetical protein